MAEISPESMQQLSAAADASLDERLVAYLRAELPEQTAAMSDKELRARVANSRERSRAIGVESDAGIAQFTCLTFLAGPEFDTIPEVRALLTTPDGETTVEERLRQLVEELSEGGG